MHSCVAMEMARRHARSARPSHFLCLVYYGRDLKQKLPVSACMLMDIVKLLLIALLVNASSGENLHHKCIHDRIAVSE